jgi:hypothetical protein
MKPKLISASLCAVAISLSAFGQQSTKPNVRISCPLLYSHPIKIVRPSYPPLARQTHVEGTVSLNCLVGADGLNRR